MSNAKYLQSFCSLVDALKYLSGEIGVETSRITLYLQERQQDPDDCDQWAEAKTAVSKQFSGVMFIIKSDSKRYGAPSKTIQWPQSISPDIECSIQHAGELS
jgi:hypothetical protein